MPDIVFKNFAGSRLAFDIDAADTLALVEDGSVFPDAPSEGEFVAVFEDASGNKEIVRCTARSGETLTITRAYEDGTDYPARAWAIGTQVEIRYTAGAMDEYFSRIGLDAGTWDQASSGAARKQLQIRRNYTEPDAVPDDLYEGELVVNGATSVPQLFLGPLGASNNGDGIPILPIVIADTAPANPFDRLLWIDGTTWQISVYDAASVSWKPLAAVEVSGDYATVAYVDDQIAEVRRELNAPKWTRMVFHQPAAPTGWLQDTSYNDRVLRVTSGNGQGNGGTWALASYMSIGSTTLSINQIPAHNHGGGIHNHAYNRTDGAQIQKPGGAGVSFTEVRGTISSNTNNSATIIFSQGGGQSHTHTPGFSSSWRPSYTNVIVAYKQ